MVHICLHNTIKRILIKKNSEYCNNNNDKKSFLRNCKLEK